MAADHVFTGPCVTLEQVLSSRTRRAERQKELLASGASCLVSFTLIIPGNIKQFPLARRAFAEGLKMIRGIRTGTVLKEETAEEPTGSEALLVMNGDPLEIKGETVSIETHHPLGRLFDMDVLKPDGMPVSRTETGAPQRSCLLCGRDAKICARSQAHSIEELREAVSRRLEDYFKIRLADACMEAARQAMLTEVSTTPKPGLVDRNNSGAHSDMDYSTFVDSAETLAPHFRRMYLEGWENASCNPQELFSRLREMGLQAERDMFAATRGSNTHKGLIFSMGLFSGALGAMQRKGEGSLEHVLAFCAELGEVSLKDFSSVDPDTSGKRCYQTYRISGIRGEAAAGFPSATNIGLPALRRGTDAGLSLNGASLLALTALLAQVWDTNMIRRGGLLKARACRQEAGEILRQVPAECLPDRLLELDRRYISENLSPGGCADLLALSLMFFFLFPEGSSGP